MCILRYTRPFHNIWQWWHHCIEVKLACSMIDIIIFSKNRLVLPDKCVSLVLEDADLLYGTKIGESLLQQLFWKTVRNATAVYRAVGWTWLVIHFVKSQRLGIGCKRSRAKCISWFKLGIGGKWGVICSFKIHFAHKICFSDIKRASAAWAAERCAAGKVAKLHFP